MPIERYAVYWAELSPSVGSEIAKTRPVAVVSDNAMNRHLQTVVVCPLTSTIHPDWPSRIQITCAGRTSEIAVDQIRTISKRRLKSRIETLDKHAAARLRARITEMYATA